jgi:spore coat polysaccharide biosynthesis protein SpsF
MLPVAIIQARMGSTRLPGKVLKPILGRPMLAHIVERARWARGVAHVVVATSDQPGDGSIREFCAAHDIACFAGSERDVLDRFYRAAVQYGGDPLLRITGDCPFVDPQVIGRVLDMYRTGPYDFVGVATGAGAIHLTAGRFPDGLDTECFSRAALKRAWQEATHPTDREHVTPYLWRVPGRFRVGQLTSDQDYSQLRWTVDTEADYRLVSQIYQALYQVTRPFLMADILDYLAAHPELNAINQALIGQEGYADVWIGPAETGTGRAEDSRT